MLWLFSPVFKILTNRLYSVDLTRTENKLRSYLDDCNVCRLKWLLPCPAIFQESRQLVWRAYIASFSCNNDPLAAESRQLSCNSRHYCFNWFFFSKQKKTFLIIKKESLLLLLLTRSCEWSWAIDYVRISQSLF